MSHLEHTDSQPAAQDGQILLREGRSRGGADSAGVDLWMTWVEISVITDTNTGDGEQPPTPPMPSLLPAKPGPGTTSH